MEQNWYKRKKEKAITLMSLVITIIVMLILAGITIHFTIGQDGVITRAVKAAEAMKIAEGKEKAELLILEETEKKLEIGEAIQLEDIKARLETEKEFTILSVKGEPLQKIYFMYDQYEYKITKDYKVSYIGNINIAEEPNLEIIQDKTETGVEEVILTVKASVEEGEISEIVKPDGSIDYKEEVEYPVTKNGSYTFQAVTAKGMKEEKTIVIKNIIQKDGINLGEESQQPGEGQQTHSHLYETKYNEDSHWKQCFFCNDTIELKNHTLETIGEAGCKPTIRKSSAILYKWMRI